MNQMMKRLLDSACKESRLIIGLMSGTSLDGLDIALCRIKGSGRSTAVELLKFETVHYSEELRSDIRSVFSKETISLERLTLLNVLIAEKHAFYLLQCLKKWEVKPSDIDCIASHGQTVYHAPKRLHRLAFYPNATLQIGDGDHIAVRTGIVTISDFRQKHLAAGGEGAPLALYGDTILFSSFKESRILLNIGGISNFTYLPSTQTGQIVSTDAGPGNTLIDALAALFFACPYDEGGNLARSGNLSGPLLEALLSHSFFIQSLPKSTGPELFNLAFIEEAKRTAGIPDLDPRDLINTITHFTAKAIADAITSCLGEKKALVYVSGGGCHNAFLLELLQTYLPSVPIRKTEELGIHPDAKEAILFALLANETICGSAINIGYGPKVTMGKISLPG